MKLSFCIIVKNEEATLPKCLSSVREAVDEMVVLDTGSTDRTPEIAREFGAKVYHFPWGGDFAAARNESLKYVTGDWVLVLDADEVLKQESVPQIKEAMLNERYILINLVRHEVGAAQSPYSLVSRLFRNHPEIYFSHPYHAMVDDSVAELLRQKPNQWQVADLSPVAIEHYGYQPGTIAALDKFTRARQAMEAYLAEHPSDPYTSSKLGALYVAAGEVERGIALLELGLAALPKPDRSSPAAAPVLYELHYHLGIAHTRLSKLSKAKSHYKAAIEQPILPQLKLGAYNNLGSLLLETGDLTGAISAFGTAVRAEPNFALGHFNLGIALKQKGRLKEAIDSYRQAIALDPDCAEAYQNLGVALLKAGNVLESLDTFREAISLYEQRQSPAGGHLRRSLKEMGLSV
ncbi:glycosyltransferase [Kamptonema formosum]|uniref:glycosyltransferase n=1 Tax=Kamptonema formosum TaxID=331992 RepID=UPI00034555F0|nr:glycosyltransferase [Oscillatoria sp. PCC 10802]